MMELLIGCGRRRKKLIMAPGCPEDWEGLVTCDVNPAHEPDVVHDLESLPWPWDDNHFDEVHAYEVLEHLGRQGDARTFFAHFQEIWRVLKPGGFLCGTSPSLASRWAWGDPGHTRVISIEGLTFLSQDEYRKQVDEAASPMTDYRDMYSGDFSLRKEWLHDNGTTFIYVIQAVKNESH